MFARLNLCEVSGTSIPAVVPYDDRFDEVALPDALVVEIMNTSFWSRCAAMEVFMKPICACIAYMEGDETTFYAVYACFLYLKFRLSKLKRN